MDFSERTIALIGEERYQKIKNSAILIVGTGGVGGYVAEFLARAGVGRMTLVDGDVVDKSNLNRQVIALQSNVGQPKTEVIKQRLSEIDPKIVVTAKQMRFNALTEEEIFSENFSFVVDAIDSVADKVRLIAAARSRGVKIVSSMGAGNRFDIPSFEVKDIFETSNDGLAKAVRKKLRDLGISDVPCVCAKSQAAKIDGVIGSISYYPPACAAVIAAYVINQLI